MEDKIIFRPMRQEEQTKVGRMMKELYKSLKAPADYMTDEKIAATFQQLAQNKGDLMLEVIEVNAVVAGYALAFTFWYNEFGGMVLNLDELYIEPEFRNKGLSSGYLAHLSQQKKEYVALSLEVLPENEKAYALYKRSGFEEKETMVLYKLLT